MTVSDAMKAAWKPIDTAPRGTTRTIQAGKDGKGARDVFEPKWVWTGRTSDKHVTKSHWIPKEERWAGYTCWAGPDVYQDIVTPEIP
jgi:hypothetical protein